MLQTTWKQFSLCQHKKISKLQNVVTRPSCSFNIKLYHQASLDLLYVSLSGSGVNSTSNYNNNVSSQNLSFMWLCTYNLTVILCAFQSTVDSQNFLLVLCSTSHLFTMNSEIFSSAMQPFAKATIEWFGHGAGPEDARLVCSEQISLSFCI